MGRNSITDDANPIWWHLGRNVQIKNTRVWETQDRIGIVRPGDSSEESRTWLSQIEDNGEKKSGAEFTNEELWSQKRKLWEEILPSKVQGRAFPSTPSPLQNRLHLEPLDLLIFRKAKHAQNLFCRGPRCLGSFCQNKIQNTSHYLFRFSIGCYVVDQGCGDGWFFGRVEILAVSLWKGFSKLRDAGRP